MTVNTVDIWWSCHVADMLTGGSASTSRCQCPVSNCISGVPCLAYGDVSDSVVLPADESCYDEVVESTRSEFAESSDRPCHKRGVCRLLLTVVDTYWEQWRLQLWFYTRTTGKLCHAFIAADNKKLYKKILRLDVRKYFQVIELYTIWTHSLKNLLTLTPLTSLKT